MPDASNIATIILRQSDMCWKPPWWAWECLTNIGTFRAHRTYGSERGAKQAACYWCRHHNYVPNMGWGISASERANV